MNRLDCENEKHYKRAAGLAILPLAVVSGLIGSQTMPVLGGGVSILLLILAIVFLVAPERKACKARPRRDD